MPYRKLPTTIISRENVLGKASEKVNSTDQSQWAVSTGTKTRLDALYPEFRQQVGERHEQFARQAAASAEENKQEVVLRQCVSHFIRVFNLAVERGKFTASDRMYYGLGANQSEMPKLSTEQDLVTWSKNIIDGEQKRLAQNGSETPEAAPMSNPASSEVQQELDKYISLSNAQSSEKQAFDAENKDVLDMLPEIDSLILDIYDEVEFYFRRETPSNKRKMARQWGVVYVSRPGETAEEGVEEEK